MNNYENNYIDSPNNKLVKLVKSLMASKKTRDEENLFVIEGIKTIKEISDDFTIKHLIINEDVYEKIDIVLSTKNKNALESIIRVMSSKAFNLLTSMEHSEGIIAVVEKRHNDLDALLSKSGLKLILLDSINDPGNLGTIIRSADAFGIDAILISNNSVDMYNPKVTRSTMGSIFHLPIINNLDNIKTINTLKNNNTKIYATNLNSKNSLEEIKKEINESNDTSMNVCIVIGNEAHGVSQEVINQSDKDFVINMKGNAESLNVSIASSLIMYELTK